MKQAVNDFDRAISLDPNYAFAHRQKAICIWIRDQANQRGAHELALEELTRATQVDPMEKLAYFHVGVIFSNKIRYGRSQSLAQKLAWCEKALEAHRHLFDIPELAARAHYNLATCYALTAEFSSATEADRAHLTTLTLEQLNFAKANGLFETPILCNCRHRTWRDHTLTDGHTFQTLLKDSRFQEILANP